MEQKGSPGSNSVRCTRVLDRVQAQTAQELFVAPDGDDRSAGTVNTPLQSIERARDIVRTMIASMQQDIVVYPRGGTYRLNKTLILGERDSGNNGWRVIYQSYPGERAILSGGTVISGGESMGDGCIEPIPANYNFGSAASKVDVQSVHDNQMSPEFHRLLSWDEAAANRIHNVMNRMADGGGLYTLSQQPGTVLSENDIYDIDRSLWAGSFPISAIYLDEGSSRITVKNNVLEHVR